MKFRTNLGFQIFMVVVYGFMDSHRDVNVNKIRIPTAKHFFKWEVWNFQRGKLCSLLMVNGEKWGTKIMMWGQCQLAIA